MASSLSSDLFFNAMGKSFAKTFRPLTFLLAFVFFHSGLSLEAQTMPTERHSSTFGIGLSREYDSYLSPISYTGAAISFDNEVWKQSRLFADDVYKQTYFAGRFGDLQNEAGNGAAMDGYFDASSALLFRFFRQGGLELFAGPELMLEMGGVYNMRNSNNPAQVKLDADLGASFQAAWNFSLLARMWRLSWQSDVPLMGFFFSPSYQKSYYEIFYLGHTDGILHASTPFNSLSSRHFLRLDVQNRKGFLRLQCSYGLSQWHAAGNSYRNDAFSISVGYVHFLQFLTPNQADL